MKPMSGSRTAQTTVAVSGSSGRTALSILSSNAINGRRNGEILSPQKPRSSVSNDAENRQKASFTAAATAAVTAASSSNDAENRQKSSSTAAATAAAAVTAASSNNDAMSVTMYMSFSYLR
jgi:hypothetical protein